MSLAIYNELTDLKTRTPAPVNGETAYLIEEGRAGLFVFKAGNFSQIAPIDSQGGIYVTTASDPSGASGVWVRQLPVPGKWHLDWFGVPADPSGGAGQVPCHTQLASVVNLANSLKPARITFGAKVYTLGGPIPDWTYKVELAGSIGPQESILIKRYVEQNVTRGVLAFGECGFTVRNLNVRATFGSGGSGISALLPPGKSNKGIAVIVDCIVSGGDCFNWSVYCNGIDNDVAPKSYRGFYIRGGQIFGAKEAAICLVGVQHFFLDGTFAATSGGTSSIVLQSGGDMAVENDDWQIHGYLDGQVNLNWVRRSVFVSPQHGDIYVDANCDYVHWYGPTSAGAVYNSAGTGFVRIP